MIRLPVKLGGRWTGRIWRYRNTAVETLFFHIWFVPLLPIGSATVELGELPGTILDRRPERLAWVSVLAAYLRVWPLVLGGGLLASWWGAWWWYARWDGGAGLAALVLALTAAGWLIGARAPRGRRARVDVTTGILPSPALPSARR